MSREVNVLNYIYENENVTQRDIANHVGMSLGGVNLLLKKMAAAGWIRILALKNPKLVQYILTPEGIREKSEKTYRYITRTYRNILKARQVILAVLKDLEKGDDDTTIQQPLKDKVYLYGEKDEVFEIIQMIIEEELGGFGDRYEYVGSIEKLKNNLEERWASDGQGIVTPPLERYVQSSKQFSNNTSTMVIIWNPDHNQRFEDYGIPYVNILEQIQLTEE